MFFVPMVSYSKADDDAKICFEQTEYDFGQIERNSSGKCRFFFTNCGKNNLVINYVRTTCGCTEAKSNKKQYKPGERGFIEVEYDTRRLGNIGKIIFVSTNSCGNEKILLRIKGEVVKTNDAFSEKRFFIRKYLGKVRSLFLRNGS